MKITSFGPEVMVTDAEPVIQLFKDLGFEPRHHQEGMTEKNVTGNVLRDANGLGMNILQVEDLPRPAISTIRMNVDDFDEAYELLKSHGSSRSICFGHGKCQINNDDVAISFSDQYCTAYQV